MQQKSSRRSEYWPTIKKFFSNWPFIIIFLFVGGAMGYISTISTKIEQILCSSGYSDQLAGKITPPLWRDLVKWLTRKLWHTSYFLLERTDFKNVIFEKNPWAPSEVSEAKGGHMVKEWDFEAAKIQIIRKKLRCVMLYGHFSKRNGSKSTINIYFSE